MGMSGVVEGRDKLLIFDCHFENFEAVQQSSHSLGIMIIWGVSLM